MTTTDRQEGPVPELDAISAELDDARRELRSALMLAGEWARLRSDEDDIARYITERITSAFDRLNASSSLAATVIPEQ